MPTSLGLHSPKLDAVRALRTKDGRHEQRRFAIEGATLVEEALRSGVSPEALFATEAGYADLGPQAAAQINAPVYLVPEKAMARISDLETPPGILAVVPMATATLQALLATGEPLLVLAGINDPGNAGTLLRSGEIFGLGGAIFGSGGVEPHNPKVVRASMGAIFRLPIAEAGPEAVVSAAKAAGYALVVTTREGTPLDRFTFERRSMLAIGNERRGVAGWLPGWDSGVAIPQRGEGESLNAAVAGGIVMHALMQQLDGPHTRAARPEKA
jgi:TrmH family RNA methyltransferase